MQSGGAVALNAGGAAFVATQGGLLLADTCETISSSAPIQNGVGPTIVPGTSDAIVVGGGNLVSFDTTALQVKWSEPATTTNVFAGSPAVAGGTIYVQNSGTLQLEARTVQDGQTLWSWRPDWTDESSFLGNVVATQNIVFVSTPNRVYAIDTTTHRTVWTYPYGGALSVSANGVLYVLRPRPVLHQRSTGGDQLKAVT